MKKTKLFTTTILLVFFIIGLSAQVTDPGKPIPVDPNVKTGKLANGMTYYIKQNKKPEQRIELRLAVNAGSVCENESQLGLAHFVEHMCFNGTKNFPSNKIINMLEEMGVKFGA
jgi:zinc protease